MCCSSWLSLCSIAAHSEGRHDPQLAASLKAVMAPSVKNRSSKLKHELVDVTPAPVLPWLERLDNRVVGRVEMLGGVLILRLVTATDMSTGETEAQMQPGVTRFQAILAPIGARRDLTYLVEMATALCHVLMLSFLDALASFRK